MAFGLGPVLTMAGVDALAVRAQEVMALRAEKGKPIGEDAADAIRGAVTSLEALKALIGEPTPITPDDHAEYLELVAIRNGVHTHG